MQFGSLKSIILAGVLATCLSVSLVLASRNGAAEGHTGGALSAGSGCNACHPFNAGIGSVAIENLPNRYRAGVTYDFGVRVSDPDQIGAGFQVSVESGFSHRGMLILADALRTEFAGGNPGFVTHTGDGVDDAESDWEANGGSYSYPVRWEAPAIDEGPINVFAAGNAVDGISLINDHFYATYKTLHFAIPGDADGDTDLDLFDFAAIQNCMDLTLPTADEACPYVDMDFDDAVTLDDLADWTLAMDGPVAPFPAGYVLADAVRGGKLYDRWWRVTGDPTPVGDHPLYPEIGQQTGSTTFRCKECHGWDYKGVDGVYGSGTRYTGIAGIYGTALSPQQVFHLLKADPLETAGGHNMDAYGMSDADVWDAVKFVFEGVVNTDSFITAGGTFPGDADFLGSVVYGLNCWECHGSDGREINFGTQQAPSYVGTVADTNPWEFLHKVRFGHPGAPMPAAELVLWDDQTLIDLGAYAQTLPAN